MIDVFSREQVEPLELINDKRAGAGTDPITSAADPLPSTVFYFTSSSLDCEDM
jgi:hypothetical protein